MEILMADKLESIIKELHFEDIEANEIVDPELHKIMKYVHVLYQLETGSIKMKNSYNRDDLFYSQYYWFDKFKKRYIKLNGHNAGLEQQSFKMLEHFSECFPGTMDWGVIEKIDNDSI